MIFEKFLIRAFKYAKINKLINDDIYRNSIKVDNLIVELTKEKGTMDEIIHINFGGLALKKRPDINNYLDLKYTIDFKTLKYINIDVKILPNNIFKLNDILYSSISYPIVKTLDTREILNTKTVMTNNLDNNDIEYIMRFIIRKFGIQKGDICDDTIQY